MHRNSFRKMKRNNMTTNPYMQAYDFTGQSVLVTGGGGVLCAGWARALFACGANVALLDTNLQSAQKVADSFERKPGAGQVLALQTNVLEPDSVQAALDKTMAEFGRIDGLINGAGGNRPTATTSAERSFFDLPLEALKGVFDLNLIGTIIPSQIVGRQMAAQKHGVILNVSSMNSYRPLTRIAAYSAAKAGVNNFTQWLAVYMAQEYSPNIRVNAIAPGFFLTEQNRFLMTDAGTGAWTERGRKIVDHTPMGRLGLPEDLSGTVLWLMSPASAFVTGIVVPVDGGFSAYSGV
jgi:NAD(P)-dependent dehydrogenase (short-subunit alcohol dehydrogenase family)